MTVIDVDATDEQLASLTASSFEGVAGVLKLECSDERLIEVSDADWTDMNIAQTSDDQSSQTTPTTYNNTDQRTFMLVKQRCDGQIFQ